MLQKEAVRVSVFPFDVWGTYLHTVGDAENISKKVKRCLAIRKVVAALNKYVCGVSQMFANTNCQVASYQLVSKRKQLNFEINSLNCTIKQVGGCFCILQSYALYWD